MNRRADDDSPALLVDIELLSDHEWHAFTLQMQRAAEQRESSEIVAAAVEICLDADASSPHEDGAMSHHRAYALDEEEWLEAAEEDDFSY